MTVLNKLSTQRAILLRMAIKIGNEHAKTHKRNNHKAAKKEAEERQKEIISP